ncbi:MAG: cyclic nucleotide-binding and patatin-like phospholipase domain-containing protein [Pseudomonadota bacterium]
MTPHERMLEVLRTSGMFSQLDEPVLKEMAEFIEIQHVRGGNLVLREGDISDSMLFVVSGGLRVSRQYPDGSTRLYNEIRPGESVGETGMILQQPRTADITAIRDSTLAVLRRENFETLLTLQPLAFNRVFVQAIYNHMRHTFQMIERRHAQSIVVIPLRTFGAAAKEVSIGLTRAFSRIGRVHHLPPPPGGDFDTKFPDEGQRIARHGELENRYEFLVYEAEEAASSWSRYAFRQADQALFVASATASEAISEIEQQLAQEPGFSVKRKHLALFHPPNATRAGDTLRWQTGRDFERIYPLRGGNPSDYERLTRFLTGTATGVVLGGGGARGFAHIGVLRALQECDIAIDLVGGNSMGALIGAQYACDIPLDEILERTRKFALGGEHLTLPVISLVSGRRIERDLQRMFGNTTIETLWRPFFAAACNLTKGCTTVQDSGPLWRAVLASNSPAGLLPPVLHHGELLVDGAILENVPVDAMRMRLGTPLEKRRGNGTIIAIDVDVHQDLKADPALTRLSVWNTLRGYFVRGAKSSPGIGDILYRAGHMGGLSQRGRTIALADHYLEPPVANFTLRGYRRAADIAEVGYRHAMKEIEKWDRHVSNR